MPTRYWLVGQEVREAVSRLEAAGGVRRFESQVDPAELAAAHERYAAERDVALPAGHRGPAPAGGVGGTRRGVKCLHAHLAWLLAGGDDPVGRLVAAELAGSAPVVALDCGTNSTRVLVAVPWPFGGGGTVALAREMRITRLGEGVDRTGRLGDDAIERTVGVLAGYRHRYEPLGPASVRAVATSALRDAANGERFLDRAEEVLGGIRPEVLGGDEEGRLSFAGATGELPAEEGPYLVMDVGGGSTELVAGTAGGDPAAVVSLDVGCVRVTERWLGGDPPAPAELAAARAAVGELVERAAREWPALRGPGTLVGLAGTVSALASISQGLDGYERSRVHHHRLSQDTVERLLAELAAVPLEERRRRRGLEPDRAGVVVGGAVVVAEVMARLGHEELLTSESDILDGIVAGRRRTRRRPPRRP